MKIAIAGYGLEGKVNYDYYVRLGHDVTIADERSELPDAPKDAKTILGKGSLQQLAGFDVVVRTPGIAPAKIHTDGKVWTGTNEFFKECTTPIIGVTGSKGKGTTCSFIAEIMRAAGKEVELVGNIGRPALEVLDAANSADVVVYELSSFQLWDLEYSPHVAVVIHIEPDHLDVHASFEQYLAAKSNIVNHMSVDDLVYVHPTNSHAHTIVNYTAGRVQKYADEETGIAFVRDDVLYRNKKQLCGVGVIALPGDHNLGNACAAIAAVDTFNIPDDAVISGLGAFSGLPHRLKFVREFDDVEYYDDSIATTPGSAIAAIKAFEKPKILVLGGSSKGADYRELVDSIASSNVKKLILVGEEAPKLEEALAATDVSYVSLGMTTMSEIVEECQNSAEAGDVVILSPAAASFDMFDSYSDRGDQFIAAVNELQ